MLPPWDSVFLLQLNLSKVIIASPLKPGCFAVFLQAAKYRLGLCLDIWDVKQLSPLVHPKGGKEERVRDISEHSRHRHTYIHVPLTSGLLATLGDVQGVFCDCYLLLKSRNTENWVLPSSLEAKPSQARLCFCNYKS